MSDDILQLAAELAAQLREMATGDGRARSRAVRWVHGAGRHTPGTLWGQ